MGKRSTSTEDELNVGDANEMLLQKKHKKHKHKKHKKKKSLEESEGSQDMSLDDGDASKQPLKLKIKFGKEAGDKNVPGSSDKAKEKISPSKSMDRSGQVGSSPKTSSKKKKVKGRESGTSSEEERWLDAIESGKLEEVDDELKKIKSKDPKLMTARQRAMFERKTDKEPTPGGEQLLALPSGYKEKVMTAEAIQKAALKSQKRKQQADEKREKDKKKTMERLLKKQESKAGKSSNKSRSAQRQVPQISYYNTLDGISISLPPNVEFPLQPQSLVGRPIPQAVKCGVDGCTNMKKYCCSQTGMPLCSIECYRKNIAALENSGRGN